MKYIASSFLRAYLGQKKVKVKIIAKSGIKISKCDEDLEKRLTKLNLLRREKSFFGKSFQKIVFFPKN